MSTSININLYLSGDVYNDSIIKSTGGPPSRTKVSSNDVNNLFADFVPGGYVAGRPEYRAVYVQNDGSNTLKNCKVWLEAKKPNTNIRFGMITGKRSTVTITSTSAISSSPEAYFTIKVNGGVQSFPILWKRTSGVLDSPVNVAQSLAAAINYCVSNSDLGFNIGFPPFQTFGVELTSRIVDDIGYLEVFYTVPYGVECNIEIYSSTFPGTVSIADSQPDFQKNIVLSDTGYPTNPPNAIDFRPIGENNSVSVGDLGNIEYVGVWIERKAPFDSSTITVDDGFILKVAGKYAL